MSSEESENESNSGSEEENEGSGSEEGSGSGSGSDNSGSGSGSENSGSDDDNSGSGSDGSGSEDNSGSGSDDEDNSGSGSEKEEENEEEDSKKEEENGRFKKIHIDLTWDPKSKKFVSSKSNVDPSSEDQEQAVKKIEKAFQNYQERKSWGGGHPLFGDKENQMTRKQKIFRAISILQGDDSPQDKELLKLQKRKYFPSADNPEKWDPVFGGGNFRKPDFMMQSNNYSQFQENSSQKPNGTLFSKEIYDGSLQFDRVLSETPSLFDVDAPRHVNPDFIRQMEGNSSSNNHNLNNFENDSNFNSNGPPGLPNYQSTLPLYI